jgi:hypothetical protein
MAAQRTGWIGFAVALGFAVVLAPPVLLFWDAIQPEPLDSRTVKIRFQSVHYEAGGLVFRYTVQNLTHRPARFLPETTQIRALQPSDRPPAGYPNLKLPLELPAEQVEQVDVRLELPAIRPSMEQSDEQTRMVLQHKPMVGTLPENDSPVSPLPMRGKIAANENSPPPPQPSFSVEDSLTDLQGFELTDSTRGIKLTFPKGW